MKRRNLKNVYIYALTAIQFMLALRVSGAVTNTDGVNFDPLQSLDSPTTNSHISTTTNSSISTKTNSPTSTTTDSPTSTKSTSLPSTTKNDPIDTTTNSPISQITQNHQATTASSPRLDILSPTTIATGTVTALESTTNITNSPVTTTNITNTPVTTTNITISPMTTTNITSSPVTTTNITSSPVTTSNITSTPVTTTNIKISPVTTTNITSTPVTTTNITNSPVTTTNITSTPVTTTNITSTPVTTTNITSTPVTTTNITSTPVTTTNITSTPVTTTNITNSPVTTTNITSTPVTTTNITNSPVTTTNITSTPVTTTNITSTPVTTTNITSTPVTTTNITSTPVTTTNITSTPVTTTNITKENITTTGSIKNMTTTDKSFASGFDSISFPDQTTQFNMNRSATTPTPPGLNTTTPSPVTTTPTLRTTTPGQDTNSSTVGMKATYVNPPEVPQANAFPPTDTVNPAPVVLEHRYFLAVPHAPKDLTLFPNSHLNATLVMITSETSAVTATVTVYEPTEYETEFLLNPGSEQLLNLTLTLESSGVSRRGVFILSFGCLQVTLFTKITYPTEDETWHLLSLSATYILPHMMLYTDYVIVSYTSASNTTSNRLFIVSADDDNNVLIRFTSYVTSPTTAFTLNGIRVIHPESIEATLPLAGQLALESEGDLTGTRVRSSRPLAVFISIIELTGDVSYEQLLPVIQSVTSFTSWHPIKYTYSRSGSPTIAPTIAPTPDSYTVASGATQVYFQLPQDNRTFILSQPGDTYQFHLNQNVNITASQSFTGLKFLHHTDTSSRLLVDCVASLTTGSLWRAQYFWAIPRYYVTQNWTATSDVYIVVIIQDMYLDFLKLDGYYFQPNVIETVLSSERYVVVTHRVGYGYHTLNNDYGLFGVFVYGEANEKKFCTTVGMNHMGHNFSNLGEFPIPGNTQKSDFQDYSVASTTSTPNNDVTTDFSTVSSADVSTSPPVNTNTTTPPPSHSRTVCPTLPTQVKLTNVTSQDLAALLDEIRDDLLMDTTKLSSNLRRLVSVPDHRPSSTGMGLSGIAFIVTCFLVLVAGDVINVGRWLRAGCRHKK